MERNTSIKYRGKEVENPLARFVIGLIAVVVSLLAILILMAFIVFIPALLIVTFGVVIITIPLNIVLRAYGRNGFYRREGSRITYEISRNSFRRRAS